MMPADAAILERRISAERLAPYRAAMNDDLEGAIALYKWNAEVAACFWSLLGHVEILVRNSMHERLETWSQSAYGVSNWYTALGGLFNAETSQDIVTARRRAIASGRTETPGRVVAELSLGFWRYLLAGRYERSLWRTCLYEAFPGQGRRRMVFERLSGLHQLRNRIAHHEPVHNRPLTDLHADALEIAGWVCPTTCAWIGSQSAVREVLGRQPTVQLRSA
jgi:hypothetical protein